MLESRATDSPSPTIAAAAAAIARFSGASDVAGRRRRVPTVLAVARELLHVRVRRGPVAQARRGRSGRSPPRPQIRPQVPKRERCPWSPGAQGLAASARCVIASTKGGRAYKACFEPVNSPYGTAETKADQASAITRTSSVRGPWTPSTRESSMSEVADGPRDEGHGTEDALGSCRRSGHRLGHPADDLPLLDDAQVVVRDERERTATLARARVEDDGPGLGDRRARSRSGRRRARRAPRVEPSAGGDNLDSGGAPARRKVGRNAEPLDAAGPADAPSAAATPPRRPASEPSCPYSETRSTNRATTSPLLVACVLPRDGDVNRALRPPAHPPARRRRARGSSPVRSSPSPPPRAERSAVESPGGRACASTRPSAGQPLDASSVDEGALNGPAEPPAQRERPWPPKQPRQRAHRDPLTARRRRRCGRPVRAGGPAPAGMSIFTGQTSAQAPHRLDANGSDPASAMPRSCGVRIAPIGPGYTEPYAWPPVRVYTGQTLRHALQRMHASVCRPTASASTFVRPLSSSTTWNSCGPSAPVTRRSTARCTGSSALRSTSAAGAGGRPRGPRVSARASRSRRRDQRPGERRAEPPVPLGLDDAHRAWSRRRRSSRR